VARSGQNKRRCAQAPKDLHSQKGQGFLCEVAAMLRAAVALQKEKAELSPQTFSDLHHALQHKIAPSQRDD
jgi:hypothetical protein